VGLKVSRSITAAARRGSVKVAFYSLKPGAADTSVHARMASAAFSR
jgi:hypothetical protein